MIGILNKVFALMDRSQLWQLAGLFFVIIFMGLVQIAGIGSIMPFLGLLTNPGLVNENEILSFAFRAFDFNSIESFLFFIGFVVLALFVLTNVMLSLTLWLITRFAWTTQARLAITLLRSYLYQPYSMFLNRNSADIGKNVLNETQLFVSGILVPLLRLGSFGIVVLFTSGFLFWYDPKLAVFSTVIIGGGYGIFYFTFQQSLQAKGRVRFALTTARYKVADEAFGSIKETKVLGMESSFISQFTTPSKEYSRAMAAAQVIKDLPRYIFETLAFSSLLVVLLYLIRKGANLQDIVPIAGMYTFAGYRLLPSVNDVYRCLAQIRFNRPVLQTIYEDISGNNNVSQPLKAIQKTVQRSFNTVGFQQRLELKNITFAYPNTSESTIQDISLFIQKGSFVGIVGQTGSGKTTLIDIILGLLSPQMGEMLADDTIINSENIRTWQDKLGYVPQDVYLTDDTVAANIAFGVLPAERDMEAVEKAARIANIHNFVIRELSQGYESIVGERGVRISGGQRQRIGIARALYHDPDLIVLDEATSNLDQATEAAVYRAIQQTAAKKTVIMIAHRLHTVQSCDILYLLEGGKLIDQGTYQDLVTKNSTFRKMVET